MTWTKHICPILKTFFSCIIFVCSWSVIYPKNDKIITDASHKLHIHLFKSLVGTLHRLTFICWRPTLTLTITITTCLTLTWTQVSNLLDLTPWVGSQFWNSTNTEIHKQRDRWSFKPLIQTCLRHNSTRMLSPNILSSLLNLCNPQMLFLSLTLLQTMMNHTKIKLV